MNLLRKFQSFYVRPFDLLPLKGIGCEIGVYEGTHALSLLRRHKAITKLWLVDPYSSKDFNQIGNLEQAFKKAYKRMTPWFQKAYFCKCKIQEVKLGALDWAYIDGDHSYKMVVADIETVWPMIKSGGIMGGHDFHRTWTGVIRAVMEFAVKNHIELHVERGDWWCFKP